MEVMGRTRYEKYGYIVFKSRTGWVAYNTNKQFEEGHTHLCSLQSAKDAIRFCIEGRVPMKADVYYLTSLQRLTKNTNYYNRLQERILEVEQYGRYC